jgi:Flp pilus assembly protein TadG
MPRIHLSLLRRIPAKDRRGVVAIFFALALVPIIVVVALAVDVSFYVQAGSQLNLAADAAAMHAVRVASQAYSQGQTTLAAAEAAGTQAGQQWFAAQLGSLTTASVPTQNIAVNVTYQTSPPGFVATVSYQGTVATHLGSFIVPSWNIAGNSGSIVQNAYLEVIMLMDNSSSMLIGATKQDILNLEYATPCSQQGQTMLVQGTGQPMQWLNQPKDQPPVYGQNYSWLYTSSSPPYPLPLYGYGSNLNPPLTPPPSAQNGQCDPIYQKLTDADQSACFYPPAQLNLKADGTCTVGGYTPVAPCGLACHTDAGGNDYYGLAQKIGVTLRLNVVHQAAAEVIQTMQSYEEVAGQYSVGVYEFNSTLQQQYPPPGGGEASTDLATALTTVTALNPPVTQNLPQTYFAATAGALAASLTPAGDGTTPTAPLKNIVIVTDGMEDDQNNGRTIAPITSATNETICQKFKDLGFTVFVLYTQYLPLPNEFYLTAGPKSIAEPLDNSQITQALTACASTPQDFFPASNSDDIKTQMQNILKVALNGPGRVTK